MDIHIKAALGLLMPTGHPLFIFSNRLEIQHSDPLRDASSIPSDQPYVLSPD